MWLKYEKSVGGRLLISSIKRKAPRNLQEIENSCSGLKEY